MCAPRRWLDRAAVALGAVLLCALYANAYLDDSARSGAAPGWFGWFDQSQTLRSTAALARGDLRPSEHHYPLGYSLLALPFWFVAPRAPFAPVDLLSLLAAFAGFVALARRLGLPPWISAPLFMLAAGGDSALFRQWVVPWNTTPVAGALWPLLALVAAWLDRAKRAEPGAPPPRAVVVGLLAGLVAACRPSEAAVLLPAAAALAWTESRARRLGGLLRVALGIALVAVPVGALHLAIHGERPTAYMQTSALIGFTWHDLGWKAYVLLLDPYPWFADGEGLFQRAPWMALVLPGALAAVLRGGKDRVLAATLAVHAALYVSYVDLLPTGLWRFLNVHYWTWAIPGYALLGALLLRDLVPGPGRGMAAGSLVVAASVLCIRVEPKRVEEGRPAKAVDFAGPLPPFLGTYFGELVLRDDAGTLHNNRDVRAIVYPGGVRVLALRRPVVGRPEWLPGRGPPGFDPAASQTRWTASVRLGWPRWTAPAPAPRVPIPVS